MQEERESCTEPVSCSDTSVLNAFVPQPLRPLHPCWLGCLPPSPGGLYCRGVILTHLLPAGAHQTPGLPQPSHHAGSCLETRLTPNSVICSPPTLPSGLRLPHHIFRESFLTFLLPPPEISSSPYQDLPEPGVSRGLRVPLTVLPATAEASAFVPGNGSCETSAGRTMFSAGRLGPAPPLASGVAGNAWRPFG